MTDEKEREREIHAVLSLVLCALCARPDGGGQSLSQATSHAALGSFLAPCDVPTLDFKHDLPAVDVRRSLWSVMPSTR